MAPGCFTLTQQQQLNQLNTSSGDKDLSCYDVADTTRLGLDDSASQITNTSTGSSSTAGDVHLNYVICYDPIYLDQIPLPPTPPLSQSSASKTLTSSPATSSSSSLDTVDSFEILEQTIIKQKRFNRLKSSDLRVKILLKRTFDLICEIMDNENGTDEELHQVQTGMTTPSTTHRSTVEEIDEMDDDDDEDEDDDDNEDSDSSDSSSDDEDEDEDEEKEEEDDEEDNDDNDEYQEDEEERKLRRYLHKYELDQLVAVAKQTQAHTATVKDDTFDESNTCNESENNQCQTVKKEEQNQQQLTNMETVDLLNNTVEIYLNTSFFSDEDLKLFNSNNNDILNTTCYDDKPSEVPSEDHKEEVSEAFNNNKRKCELREYEKGTDEEDDEQYYTNANKKQRLYLRQEQIKEHSSEEEQQPYDVNNTTNHQLIIDEELRPPKNSQFHYYHHHHLINEISDFNNNKLIESTS